MNGASAFAMTDLSGGVATVMTSFPAGTYNISAVYTGSPIYAAASSNTVVQNYFTAGNTATTTTLSSSSNPSSVGQNTTLTATLNPSAATGSVTFKANGTVIGTTVISSGVATLATSFATTGNRSLTATYNGDTTHALSTSANLTQGVVAATTTSLASSVNPSTPGQSLVLTATVVGVNPTGTVTFRNGAATIGTGAVTGAGNSRTATLTTSTLPTGIHSLTAQYGGDSGNGSSTSGALSQTVGTAGTLPTPPSSPTPVASYEYDANGNPTRVVQAPGVSGFGFATATTYDRLNRARNTTDARNGLVQRDYNGREDLTQVTDPRNLVTSYPRDGLGQAIGLVSPDTGTAGHAFDAAGNLLTRTDSRGVLATYSYDALNRLTGVVYSASGQASRSYGWTHDQTGSGFTHGIGRLTTATFPEGLTRFAYDAQGRLTSSAQTVNAASGANPAALTHTTSYAYDAAGNVTAITYPSGRVLSIVHTDGVPSALSLAADAVATPVSLIGAIQWEPFGAAKGWQWQLDSGTQTHERIYDSAGRLVRYRLGGVVRDISYDAADRISAYTHYDAFTAAANPSLDQAFGYDELGRLTGVSTASASWSIGYDANGNRTSVTQSGNTRAYTTAATSNRLTALSNPAVSFTHDNAGNTLTGSTAATAYSSAYLLENRLGSVTANGVTSTYSYNNAGQRVRKVASTGSNSTVIFVYDQQGHLLGEYDSTGAALREYVWLGDEPVAVFMPNGANPPTIHYIHNDHINTPRVVVDRGNGLRWRWLTEPFGTTAPENNPQGLGAFAFNLRMPGQYADSETGLFYNWHRDYDASVGRYVQSDPIGLSGGLNTYSYADGTPTSKVDPTGEFGVVGAIGMGTMNTGFQVAYLQYGTNGDLASALRCVDLRKVVVNAGFGMAGPTVLGNSVGPRLVNALRSSRFGSMLPGSGAAMSVVSLNESASTAVLAALINNTLSDDPVTVGSKEECDCVRRNAAERAPESLRNVLRGLTNLGLY